MQPVLEGLNGDCVQVYDVYRSSKVFSPKSPGDPVARVCIAGPAVPSIYDMLRAERASPGVPVKFAICRSGTVAFQSFVTGAVS